MRAESNIVPEELCVESLGETARLRFCENVRRNEEGAELEYVYDEYTVEVAARDGLEEMVRKDISRWREYARLCEERRFGEVIRAKRDRLLKESDWTQGADSPLDDERRRAFAEYRRKLRDMSEQAGFPYNVTFPEKPE